MGLFEHWPYTNFHNLNLDWIIETLTTIKDEYDSFDVDTLRSDITDLQTGLQTASESIDDLQDDYDSVLVMYQTAINLCNQILDILDGQNVNPNIGYMQNQTIDEDAEALIYNAMQSYQLSAWSIAGNNITYGNYVTNNISGTSGTPLDPAGSFTTRDKLDCSSFVMLSLMGIPYDAAFSGDIQPRTAFSRQYNTKPRRNPDGLLRWAADIYEMAEAEGMLFDIGDHSQLRTGDVVFWKWTDAEWNSLPDDSFAKADGGAYKHVAHVGMIVSDCSAFASGIGLMHCVSTTATMAFVDFETFSAATLDLMPYAMRPRKVKALAEPVFNGLTILRKLTGRAGYTLNDHSISFSGGRIPTNSTTYGLNETTGAEDTSKTNRITTPMLPFNPSMVIENYLSGTKYKAYYYDANDNFVNVSDNQILRPGVGFSKIRLEFYNTPNGNLTAAQRTYLIANTIIRYHIMADALSAQAAGDDGNTDADTFYYLSNQRFDSFVNV